jgi:hypothetical protein
LINPPTHFLRNKVRGEAAIKPIVESGSLCGSTPTEHIANPVPIKKILRRQIGVFRE